MKESDELDKSMQELKKTLSTWTPPNPVEVKRMKPVETLSLIAMLVFLIAPWFLAGLNIWGWLFVCIAALVIGFEIYSTIKNGKTISQIFWIFKKAHPRTAWVIFIGASIGWIMLGIHLLS